MTKRNLRSKESNLGDDAEKLYQNKIRDLESVNQSLKRDVEELRSKLADVSINSSAGSKAFSHNSSATKDKPMSSRSKSNLRSISSAKKHNTGSQEKQSDGEVQRLKAQKVKLQCKIKLDSMHFRLLKASLEKEIFQAKKELRKSEFEKHVLSALNRRQKLILQLKNTQALTALKRLQLLPQSKRISSNKNNGPLKGTCSKVQESSNEVGLVMKLNKIHSSYERQMKEMAEEVKKFGLEADMLKAEFEGEQNFCSAASSDIRINRSPMDSELMELKEEFNKLSTMVSQLEMTKSQLSEINNVQGEPKYSVSSKNTNDQSNLELSQPKSYKKTLCSTDGQANLELSQPKTPEETLCNTNDQSNLEASQTKNSERMMLCDSSDTNDLSKLEPSQPEISEEALCKKQESKAEMCCSCTKKSLCKTKSCKCRANGSGCGSSCGCLASKCSNREDSVKSDKAMQPVTSKKPAGVSRDGKEANKQPLRDIGNIQEAAKVGKLKKVQKRVAKK